MAGRFRAVLAIAAGGSTPPWGELARSVLPAAFRESGLDWQDAEHGRSGPGLLIAMPAAAAGPLARVFGQHLADAIADLPGPVRLGLGLAVGMCHRDDRGWYGDSVTTARRLADPPAEDDPFSVRLAIAQSVRSLEPGLGAEFAEVTDPHDGLAFWVRTAAGMRPRPPAAIAATTVPARNAAALNAAALNAAALNAAALNVPALNVAAEMADRTSPDSPARLVAEAVDAVAAPIAAFAEQLPTLLSPDVAPSDVLAWMYRALGVDSPQLLDDRHGRRLLSGLVRCYQRRGTARGLAELIELRYGVGVEIVDPGATTWSAVPETPVRQPPGPVGVLLDTDEPLVGLDEVIRSALPVGVGYRVSRRPRRTAGSVS